DARLADELRVDPRLRVRALQVEDELLEVFDRVDVVVRRRRDEADARRRVARARDPRIDLRGRQLTALAGLGTLRELDLQVLRVREIHARHTEAARGDLLDRAAALRIQQALDVLAALAGVRLGAEAVHRDREGFVRLARDRAVAHRAGREPLDDARDGFDLVDRNGAAQPLAELEQAAQRLQRGGLVVDQLRVLAEDVVAARARGVLQTEDRLRVEQVGRAVAAPLVLAARPESLVRTRRPIGRVGE